MFLKELKSNFSSFNQTVISHLASIEQLKTQLRTISFHLNQRPKDGLPSDTMVNPKNDNQNYLAITTRSGKVFQGSVFPMVIEVGKNTRPLYSRGMLSQLLVMMWQSMRKIILLAIQGVIVKLKLGVGSQPKAKMHPPKKKRFPHLPK